MITQAEIKKDIINSLKQPLEMSKSSYKKLTIPCIIIACLLIVVTYTHPKIILYALLFLLVSPFLFGAVSYFRLQHKIKNVHTDDYAVITAVLSHTSEESYVLRRPKWYNSERVNNYTLYFENGESWRVPKDNYNWSERRRMSNVSVYQSSHRGDVFIIVVKKDTGIIVTAYNSGLFEYKE